MGSRLVRKMVHDSLRLRSSSSAPFVSTFPVPREKQSAILANVETRSEPALTIYQAPDPTSMNLFKWLRCTRHGGNAHSGNSHNRNSDGTRRTKTFTNRVPSTPKQRFAGAEVMCNLCAENGTETKIPLNAKVTRRCTSFRTVCVRCLERHILQCVEKSCFTIGCVCVSEGCSEQMNIQEIRQHASTELFERYDTGLLHVTLERDPEFCWCARAGCGSGQLHSSRERAPIVRCHACGFKTCFTHNCEWHNGRTCKQYDIDAKNSEEVGLLQLLENQKKFRRCPHCGNGVEKNHGCDHMTCRCKHEFCWRCLAPYQGADGIFERGNNAHARSCRHYRV